MRIERWYWLGYFCVLSLLIHVGLVLRSRAFTMTVPEGQRPGEIEVALQAPEPEKPKEPPKPKPKLIVHEKKVRLKEDKRPEREPRARVRQAHRVPREKSPIRIAKNNERPSRPTRKTPVENPQPDPVADPGTAPGA